MVAMPGVNPNAQQQYHQPVHSYHGGGSGGGGGPGTFVSMPSSTPASAPTPPVERWEQAPVHDEYLDQMLATSQVRLQERIAARNFGVKHLRGDGNCQFGALAFGMWQDEKLHSLVRADVLTVSNPDSRLSLC